MCSPPQTAPTHHVPQIAFVFFFFAKCTRVPQIAFVPFQRQWGPRKPCFCQMYPCASNSICAFSKPGGPQKPFFCQMYPCAASEFVPFQSRGGSFGHTYTPSRKYWSIRTAVCCKLLPHVSRGCCCCFDVTLDVNGESAALASWGFFVFSISIHVPARIAVCYTTKQVCPWSLLQNDKINSHTSKPPYFLRGNLLSKCRLLHLVVYCFFLTPWRSVHAQVRFIYLPRNTYINPCVSTKQSIFPRCQHG